MSDKIFSSVVALLGFNGANNATSTTDEAATPQTYTFNGNAKLSTANKKFGSAALLLDGNGDYIRANDAALNLNDSIYTVEAWAYYDAASYKSTHSSVFSNYDNNQSNSRIALFVQSDGHLNAQEQTQNGSSAIQAISTVLVPLRQWNHIAMVRTGIGSGDSILAFLNGVLVASATGAPRNNYTNVVEIGRNNGGTGFERYWLGSIDEFRLTKGVARYTADFVVPQGPFSRAKRTGTANQGSQPVVSTYKA